jgi:CheY-like chemotaxis protein
MRVLVVEDDDVLRGMARRVLERSGFAVVEAATGDAALRLCEEHYTDLRLVLLDLTMPGLSGEATLGEIRRRWPALPIVVSSGLVPEDNSALAGVPFLAKPYRPSELVDAVRRAIEDQCPT